MRIRGTKPEYKKRTIPGHVKAHVVRRYGAKPGPSISPARCHYCDAEGSIWWPFTYTGKIGTHMVLTGLEFDHFHPEFHGGETTPENIVLACRPCNRGKGHSIPKGVLNER